MLSLGAYNVDFIKNHVLSLGANRDNNRRRILGVGDIGGDDDVIIKDVVLVDGLKHILINISQLCDKGYKTTFELDLCLIADSKTSETIVVGKRVNNVFMLNVSCITSSMKC